MKVISPILPKIAMATSLGESKKLVRMDNIHTDTFHLVKNSENRSSRSWDGFAQFKKEERNGR